MPFSQKLLRWSKPCVFWALSILCGFSSVRHNGNFCIQFFCLLYNLLENFWSFFSHGLQTYFWDVCILLLHMQSGLSSEGQQLQRLLCIHEDQRKLQNRACFSTSQERTLNSLVKIQNLSGGPGPHKSGA